AAGPSSQRDSRRESASRPIRSRSSAAPAPSRREGGARANCRRDKSSPPADGTGPWWRRNRSMAGLRLQPEALNLPGRGLRESFDDKGRALQIASHSLPRRRSPEDRDREDTAL